MWEDVLIFFRSLELWIYLFLGLGALFYIRKFVIAWQELREAGFGLERENAQVRLNHAASVMVLLITIAVSEFVLVSFIAPMVPGATPLLTPTLNLLATPSTTLPALTATAFTTLNAGQVVEGTPLAPAPVAQGEGCVVGQIEINSPENGTEISGQVPITGTADIENFGFYQVKMKLPTDPDNLWATIQAGNQPVRTGELVVWDTRRLSPGQYQIALVVVDNQAQASDPCIIQVSVARPADEPFGP